MSKLEVVARATVGKPLIDCRIYTLIAVLTIFCFTFNLKFYRRSLYSDFTHCVSYQSSRVIMSRPLSSQRFLYFCILYERLVSPLTKVEFYECVALVVCTERVRCIMVFNKV